MQLCHAAVSRLWCVWWCTWVYIYYIYVIYGVQRMRVVHTDVPQTCTLHRSKRQRRDCARTCFGTLCCLCGPSVEPWSWCCSTPLHHLGLCRANSLLQVWLLGRLWEVLKFIFLDLHADLRVTAPTHLFLSFGRGGWQSKCPEMWIFWFRPCLMNITRWSTKFGVNWTTPVVWVGFPFKFWHWVFTF